MKASTAKIIQIAATIITVLALWFIVVLVVSRSNLFDRGFFRLSLGGEGGAFETSGSYEVTEAIQNVSVEWISGHVSILLDDGDTIRFEEAANRAIEEQDALFYETNGNTLCIKYTRPGFSLFNWNRPSKTLTVYWPRQALAALSDVRIETVSAPIEIPEFAVQNTVRLETVSGRVDAGSLSAADILLESVSGSISLSDGAADRIQADAVSGEIDLTFAEARYIQAESVSGQVRIWLDGIDAFALDFDSVSGRQQVGEGLVQRSDADLRIAVDTVSGSLQIEKAR